MRIILNIYQYFNIKFINKAREDLYSMIRMANSINCHNFALQNHEYKKDRKKD